MRNLLSFIRDSRSCPGGESDVSVEKEVRYFKRKYSNVSPIILIDFTQFLKAFRGNSEKEILCAGREKLCSQKAESLIKKLCNLGIKLIFFLGGPVKDDKLAYYKSHCDETYNNVTKYFNPDESVINLNEVPKSYKKGMITPIYFDAILNVARKYGEIRISLENQCVLDLAIYANKNEHVLAVVACDTDFVMMEGDYQIWLPFTIDHNSLECKSLNKVALRSKLNLSKNQMIIFSTLSGNSIILPEMVENHIQGIRFRQQPFHFAKIVQKLFPNGIRNEADIDQLSSMIQLGSNNTLSTEKAKNLTKKSLDFYNIEVFKDSEVPGWIENHIKETNSTLVYTTLENNVFSLQTYCIYLDMPNTPVYTEQILTIILRQMGFILRAQNELPSTRKIFYKRNHCSEYETIEPDLIYPVFDVPPLDYVIECGKTSLVDIKQKFKILSWIISPNGSNINPDVLQNISETSFLMPIMILNFCVKEGLFSVEEADILLLSLLRVKDFLTEQLENFPEPKTILTRAFYISHVYAGSIYVFLNALVVSGLYYLYKPGYYDGYVFHDTYSNILGLPNDERNQYISSIDADLLIYKN